MGKLPRLGIALLLLVFALGVQSSSNSRAAASPSSDGSSSASDGTTPDALAARARLDGVSLEEAGRRARVDREAGAMQAEAQSLAPDGYAGSWVDWQNDYSVHVAYTSRAAANVDRLRRGHPSLVIVPETRALSLAQLSALQGRLIAARSDASQGGDSADIPNLLKGAKGRFDLDIDVITNTVVVFLPDASDALTSDLQSRFGSGVTSRVSQLATPAACTDQYSCSPGIFGGLPITDAGGAGCTAGYLVRDGSGNRRILTAGHCGAVGSGWYLGGSGQYYGAVNNRHFGGDSDGLTIAPGGSFLKESSKIFENNRPIMTPTGLITWGNLGVGTAYCKEGVVSGFACGHIGSKTFSPTGPDYPAGMFNMVRLSACTIQGDSGGPEFDGTTAAGITSGLRPGVACNAGDRQAGGGETIFSAIDFALFDLGVNLLLGVTSPPVANFSSSCTILRKCTFTSSSYDADGSVVGWTWFFGDNSSATGSTVTHTYTLPGNKTVSLYVSDNDGAQTSVAKTVSVT